MSMNLQQTAVLPGAIGRSNLAGVRIPADFGIVCLWSFLGLNLAALAVVLGFGTEITEILAIAG